ncbi:MAG: hypothetical protein IJP64_01285 [Oscillospiraceae bacterium]|nr:hypothetical protein [Oscillospiraceae bacterium]
MKKKVDLAAVLLALSLLLTACAGGPAADTPPATGSPETQTPEPTPSEEQEKTDEELAAFYSSPENLYLLDLTLPLLEEGYVDADTAAFARASALSLTRYARNAGKAAPDDLVGDGEELVELKNGWLDAIGATEDYTPFAPLHFERSTIIDADVYPFMVRGSSANWYFSLEDVREQGYVDFFSSYLRFAPLAERDFADAREYLKDHLPEDNPPVKICVGFHQGNVTTSWFSAEFQYADNDHNRIQLYHDWDSAAYSLLHEYVHYLRREESLPSAFCTEAITEEISTFECENRLQMLCSFDRENKEAFLSYGVWDEENDCLNYRNYEIMAAASYYMGYSGTYISIARYAVTHPEKMSWNYLSYEEGACLARYITELYGKDALLECSTNADLDELIGKPVDEFYREFGEWLLDRYAAFSRS